MSVIKSYVGRLAPSPTGALHLGNVRTFMVAWLRARANGGKVIMRIEDLDHPRDKPGAEAQAIEDLKWLGFDWDEEYRQSERIDLYRDAIRKLHREGRAYPCVCSRRDVEAAQSAPHEGDQLFYAGACRGRFADWEEATKEKELPCWRFAVRKGEDASFVDAFAGPYSVDVSRTLGDFPLARDENGAGYTLAVVVDDLDMGVTEVVRGDDLLAATPAQILIARALGASEVPSYCHVPLVVGPDGRRLAKRHGDTRISSFRSAGMSAEKIIGLLGASCGWCSQGEEVALEALLPRFSLETIPHKPFIFQ